MSGTLERCRVASHLDGLVAIALRFSAVDGAPSVCVGWVLGVSLTSVVRLAVAVTSEASEDTVGRLDAMPDW